MLRTLLIALFVLPLAAAHAQAPIERLPPTTTTTPDPVDPAWAIFMETSADAIAEPIRVHTDAQTLHCILTGITPDALACQRPTPIFFRPRWDAPIPRTRILKVDTPDHVASGLIGGLIGWGIGITIAATHSQADSPGNAVLVGAPLGCIAGYFSYRVPFIHHTLYRAP